MWWLSYLGSTTATFRIYSTIGRFWLSRISRASIIWAKMYFQCFSVVQKINLIIFKRGQKPKSWSTTESWLSRWGCCCCCRRPCCSSRARCSSTPASCWRRTGRPCTRSRARSWSRTFASSSGRTPLKRRVVYSIDHLGLNICLTGRGHICSENIFKMIRIA